MHGLAALVASLLALSLVRWLTPPPRDNSYIVVRGRIGPGSCAAHGFAARLGPPALVIDLILFNREFEVLDMRLHKLAGVVDAFVIVESDRPHANAPKPLRYFWEARVRPE